MLIKFYARILVSVLRHVSVGICCPYNGLEKPLLSIQWSCCLYKLLRGLSCIPFYNGPCHFLFPVTILYIMLSRPPLFSIFKLKVKFSSPTGSITVREPKVSKILLVAIIIMALKSMSPVFRALQSCCPTQLCPIMRRLHTTSMGYAYLIWFPFPIFCCLALPVCNLSRFSFM